MITFVFDISLVGATGILPVPCEEYQLKTSLLALTFSSCYSLITMIHALDYLDRKRPSKDIPVYAVFGDEAFLKQETLTKIRSIVCKDEEAEISRTVFSGKEFELRDVLDTLSTRSLFGNSQTLVELDAADDFVSANRPALEKYCQQPKSSGVLVFVLATLPSNTKLYKAIDKVGLAIQCKSPQAARMKKWLQQTAKNEYNKTLSAHSADLLLELGGTELGILKQELAKLAALAGDNAEIPSKSVQEMVGGWKTKTAWEMLDAALNGDAASALEHLEQLILGGEHPVAILAQISFSLRKFAAATQIILKAEQEKKRLQVRQVLQQVGFKPFIIGKAESQLRKLGRTRGDQLYGWLLQTDFDLKGDSQLPPRVVLEQLIVRLAN